VKGCGGGTIVRGDVPADPVGELRMV
jgi:hypothetical protein